jgi:hypothetical protein
MGQYRPSASCEGNLRQRRESAEAVTASNRRLYASIDNRRRFGRYGVRHVDVLALGFTIPFGYSRCGTYKPDALCQDGGGKVRGFFCALSTAEGA